MTVISIPPSAGEVAVPIPQRAGPCSARSSFSLTFSSAAAARSPRTASGLDGNAIANNSCIGADQHERYGADDSEPRPSFAGIEHLRRRIVGLGDLQSRQLERLLVRTPPDLGAAVAQLILLTSAVQPGVTADALLTITQRLRAEIAI